MMVESATQEMDDHKGCDQEGRNGTKHLDPAWRRRSVVVGARHLDQFYDTLCLWSIRNVSTGAVVYTCSLPKLWNETIEEHRREVRDTILNATVTLVGEHGLSSVTMSQIAQASGIGRATLYKYFADVQAILIAWHERQVSSHLAQLTAVRDHAGDAAERLELVLETFALISHEHHDTELAAVLHRGDHVVRAHQHLTALVRDLITEGAKAGILRDDVAPVELATYCLHALSAASSLSSKAAVKRLVGVTLSGLRRLKR